ncbi:hypothetical protein ACHAXA_000030 [Cyclostephanos tholiformis]|uniref:Uncharacterized protein n=1 Tax=Cyclostephanos tholiformis TaxID=382380 RepID=A0ABD3SRG6_9STRA
MTATSDCDHREGVAKDVTVTASDDDEDDNDSGSVDSCEAYINFESIRNARSMLEESISFSWPGIYDDDDDDYDDYDDYDEEKEWEDDDIGEEDVQCEDIDDADGGGTTMIKSATATTTTGGKRNERRRTPRKIVLSTLLEEYDLAPLFDGATWAGTRLWAAAIRAVQYLSGRLPPPIIPVTYNNMTSTTSFTNASKWEGTGEYDAIDIVRMMTSSSSSRTTTKSTSVLELGCGLGVPGMILHLLGCDVVLTDQSDILSQLEKNVASNFPERRSSSHRRINATSSSSMTMTTPHENDGGVDIHDDIDIDIDIDNDESRLRRSILQRGRIGRRRRRRRRHDDATIRAMPLSWSRDGAMRLLEDLDRTDIGFDIVLNCDCVYEPLYGKSWHLLNETIDELLRINPSCLVVSSMERRVADGIDDFIDEMRKMTNVGGVEKVWYEEGRQIEIYVTRGR